MKLKNHLILASSILFLMSCDGGKSPKQYATPNPPVEKVQDEGEVFSPEADILFVIDDSGSMSSHQQNLIANISTFIAEFTKGARLDYHIGVVTTDADGYSGGELQGSPKFVTPTTPDHDNALKRNLNRGTWGSSTERSFDGAYHVFSAANATVNAGFIRPSAALAVIFITDAEDQSSIMSDPKVFYDFLVKQKNSDPRKVLGYGALVVPNELPNCFADGYGPPTTIFEFLKMVVNGPNNDLRLCAPDFGKKLSAFAQNIVTNAGRTIYLTRLPWAPSIRVVYGTLELPSDPEVGWMYDRERNAVVLAEGIPWDSQPLGSQVKVYFDAVSTK